ncbi:MAG TPA: hypothetical protein VHN14_16485 [Kofleriaceae bacterium]|nr:hypothetical protein [Kofleriaceae bacterium]
MAQVESAKTAWQRADLTWRQLRIEAATERLAMLVCEREFVRARTIDHHMVGNDTYNIAPLRGQFSRAQQRWHNAATAARQAHEALDRASAALAAAKEVYATLMRGGPPTAPPDPPAGLTDRPPLLLTGWAVTRREIRHRRGVRTFLDEGATPQLRGVAIHLTAKRDAQALGPAGAAPPAGAPAENGKPAGDAPRGNAPAMPPVATNKPADRPTTTPPSAAAVTTGAQGNPPPNAANVAAKPAERPAAPASSAGSSANGKPSAQAPRSSAP